MAPRAPWLLISKCIDMVYSDPPLMMLSVKLDVSKGGYGSTGSVAHRNVIGM